MDDLKYLDTLAEISRELREICDRYDLRSVGIVGKANLVGLRREQNAVLADCVRKHNRVLRFIMGEPVEPEAHAAEAVLVGVGSAGG